MSSNNMIAKVFFQATELETYFHDSQWIMNIQDTQILGYADFI